MYKPSFTRMVKVTFEMTQSWNKQMTERKTNKKQSDKQTNQQTNWRPTLYFEFLQVLVVSEPLEGLIREVGWAEEGEGVNLGEFGRHRGEAVVTQCREVIQQQRLQVSTAVRQVLEPVRGDLWGEGALSWSKCWRGAQVDSTLSYHCMILPLFCA